MAKAIDVARYLIRLASAENEPEPLSNMRLQKLLYYVQGWSLAHRNKPMFSDRVEAWPYGPVVPPVYGKFKVHGRGAIPESEGSDSGLTQEEADFVGEVWEAYKEFSAIALYKMTHGEPPWKNARKGLPPEAPSKAEITNSSMREFFSSLA